MVAHADRGKFSSVSQISAYFSHIFTSAVCARLLRPCGTVTSVARRASSTWRIDTPVTK